MQYIHYNFADCGRETEMAQKIYKSFMEVWREEYKVIDNYDKIFSDYFLQHDAVSCIQHPNGDIVAGLFSRYTNLRNPIHREQKFFEEWPAEIIDDLAKDYQNISIIGHLFVLPKYRGFSKLSKYIISLETMQFFYRSDEEVQIAALRNNKAVNRLCRLNGSTLLRNVNLRNLDVDLVKFTREDVSEAIKKFDIKLLELFNQRIEYGNGKVSHYLRQENESTYFEDGKLAA